MAISVPPIGRYDIDPAQSSIVFSITHNFGVSRVTGSFGITSGVITIADDAALSTIDVTIDPTTVDTGNRLRDVEVRSRLFLDSGKHPTITFTSVGAHNDDGSWQVPGVVTAHGKDAATTLTVGVISLADTGFRATAAATVDRYAHGVKGARGLLGRELELTLSVSARPAALGGPGSS